MRLRDHGNEMVVGLVLLEALESERGGERASSYREPLGRMLDRILSSANPDGLLYDEIRPSDLAPVSEHLSDNWGYVYGAVYTHFMVTGEERYREAVRRVLRNLPRYRGHDWESGSQDGYADAIESAIYLVNREPVPEALDWIETETARLIAFQQEDGTIERWYGDGNWARTLLLYAMMKTQGCFLDGWQEGVRLGAVREGERLFVSLEAPAGWKGRLRFDHARHRRDLNFARNYVRLNEWPEWYTVDENTLYRLTDAAGQETVRLGSDLEEGIEVAGSGRWIVEPAPLTRPPIGREPHWPMFDCAPRLRPAAARERQRPGGGRPPGRVRRLSRSERQLGRELDVALRRAAQGARRVRAASAEIVATAALPIVRFGWPELRVVQDVERLAAQLEVEAADLGVLDERHVDVELRRAAHARSARRRP